MPGRPSTNCRIMSNATTPSRADTHWHLPGARLYRNKRASAAARAGLHEKFLKHGCKILPRLIGLPRFQTVLEIVGKVGDDDSGTTGSPIRNALAPVSASLIIAPNGGSASRGRSLGSPVRSAGRRRVRPRMTSTGRSERFEPRPREPSDWRPGIIAGTRT